MYSKIAYKNVKKSFKDYSIYFLTLTLAVCIFYSFNSIESQNAMMEMNKSGKEYVQILTTIISYASVFVAFILGSLILYANNFLIKKQYVSCANIYSVVANEVHINYRFYAEKHKNEEEKNVDGLTWEEIENIKDKKLKRGIMLNQFIRETALMQY